MSTDPFRSGFLLELSSAGRNVFDLSNEARSETRERQKNVLGLIVETRSLMELITRSTRSPGETDFGTEFRESAGHGSQTGLNVKLIKFALCSRLHRCST